MGRRKSFCGINLETEHNASIKTELFYDIILRRRSVRKFSRKPIDSNIIKRLISILRRAPSAANRQPWFFYVISGSQKEKFNEVFYKKDFSKAPLIIAGCAVEDDSWVRKTDNKKFAWVDVAIALTEMIIAATAEGLGTCWVASFDIEKAKSILGMPDKMEIVSLVVLGYPQKPLAVYHNKKRKKLKEITKFI